MPTSPQKIEHSVLKPKAAVRVFGPASLSNLGPGFDTLGLCLEGVGDVIEARLLDSPGVNIVMADHPFSAGITLDPNKNTAGVAAQLVASALGYTGGLALHIQKGFKPGSGIGSSAASAVGAAYAVGELLSPGVDKQMLIEPVLGGEAMASGARHGDNVLPALFGGLVLVSSSEPANFRKIAIPSNLWLVVILPEVQVLTREARAMLPKQVPMKHAVNQASSLAFMIEAFRAGDWAEVGRRMMEDQLAEPVRSTLVPCYTQIKAAAMAAGAFGCALTGSGPAMFAISDKQEQAQSVLLAMQEASLAAGVASSAYLSRVNDAGVQCATSERDVTSERDSAP